MEPATLQEPSTAATDEVAELDKLVAERREREAQKADIELEPSGPKRVGETIAAMTARFLEPNPERDARVAAQEEEAKRQRIAAEQQSSWSAVLAGCGSEYAKCRLETYRLDCLPVEFRKRQEAVHQAVCEYAGEIATRVKECTGLVLYGPVGTGKDHLAVSVCRKAIAQELRASWINGQQWFSSIRDAMDSDLTESRILSEVTYPHLLVVSDPLPSAGELTAFQSTWMYRLADARRSAGRPTIVTINVASDAEADRRLGEATWDRFCYDAWKVHCNWPSYRKPARLVNC